MMIEKKIDPSWCITNVMSFDDVVEAYRLFDEKKEGYLKVLLKV